MIRRSFDFSVFSKYPLIWQLLLLVAGLIPGLVNRLQLTRNNLTGLTLKFLPDDAFYYFKIAQNIVAGNGSTFDNISMTNGYHPLWMLILLPVFSIYEGLQEPVQAALCLGAIFTFFSAIVMFLILRELGVSAACCFFGALIFYYNYQTGHFALNGMETSVCTLMVSLAYLVYVRGMAFESRRFACLFGVVLGLAVLARTDMALFGVPIALDTAIRLLRKRKVDYVICIVVAGALTVGPWFVWNSVHFGSIIQVSGKALSFYEHKSFLMAHPDAGLFSKVYLQELMLHAKQGLWGLGSGSGIPPIGFATSARPDRITLFIIGLFVFAVAVSGYSREKVFYKRTVKLWPAILFIVIYFVVHDLIRWTPRNWYRAVPGYFIFIFLAMLVDAITTKIKWSAVRIGIVAILTTGLVYTYHSTFKDMVKVGVYSKVRFVEGAIRVRKRFKAGTRIGVSDCGYYGYVLPEMQVVNLDGLVNNAAFKANKAGRLAEYLNEQRIEYAQIRPYLLKKHFMGMDWRNRLRFTSEGWLIKRENPNYDGDRIYYHMMVGDEDTDWVMSENWTPQDGEAWSDGLSAKLKVVIEKPVGNLNLKIYCMPFLVKNFQDQNITYSINGVQQEGVVDVPAKWSFVTLPLVMADLRPGINEIVLQFSQAVAPADVIPGSQDARKLGILVRELAVTAPVEDVAQGKSLF